MKLQFKLRGFKRVDKVVIDICIQRALLDGPGAFR